ncbi:hypothetical protein AK88_05558 [Plasmodium fragile]|uniref:Uncharacterized protein n=1 Tax=Plasmodium fragile TaxID=5857 RepID=A0A0D9QCW0_PLAFR|nr:uncharacterized protein AK88_05558 [Plasmodium fragile]KJP84814.1 hypothetical protein AK88_05558 [Plasmodium fragile]
MLLFTLALDTDEYLHTKNIIYKYNEISGIYILARTGNYICLCGRGQTFAILLIIVKGKYNVLVIKFEMRWKLMNHHKSTNLALFLALDNTSIVILSFSIFCNKSSVSV